MVNNLRSCQNVNNFKSPEPNRESNENIIGKHVDFETLDVTQNIVSEFTGTTGTEEEKKGRASIIADGLKLKVILG